MARRPTIIDVARVAGVSKATVARVVSGQAVPVRDTTRQRVLRAVQELGYERNAIAGSLRTDQTFMVALCIPDITNPFWPVVARGVQDTIEREGYATVTVNSDWNAIREQNYLRMVRRNRFDGLIINPMAADDEALCELGVPVVILGSGDNYPDLDSVGSDTESGAQAALDHLLALGHRRIALIAGRSQRRQQFARYESYRAFHKRHNLPLDPSLVIECDFSDTAGLTAMERLLRHPDPPTAVFAANDVLAIGALKAAQALHWRVPDDISIIGMDDIYSAATTSPALTTIAKPKYDIGVKAANLLLMRLKEAQSPPQHVLLPCTLMRRASTSAIRPANPTT
ncbi:MAG: LacI family DNA-binding transcriptional regulator [Anaerolineae bacterium]|nr:LacI family DNA-binding transcriptional regulator [Anaerolineae bacterium]